MRNFNQINQVSLTPVEKVTQPNRPKTLLFLPIVHEKTNLNVVVTVRRSYFYFSSGVLPSARKSSPSGLSPNPPSGFTWGRDSPDRPSSSPSPTHTRKYSPQQLTPSSLTRVNARFSRHMARSAPDIQILSLDEPS